MFLLCPRTRGFVYSKEPSNERFPCFYSGGNVVAVILLLSEGNNSNYITCTNARYCDYAIGMILSFVCPSVSDAVLDARLFVP